MRRWLLVVLLVAVMVQGVSAAYPKAFMYANNNMGTGSLTVLFKDMSLNSPKTYNWSFNQSNLATYSEQFNNSLWVKQSGSVNITTDATIAPDGTMTGDMVYGQGICRLIDKDSNWSSKTMSVYLKATPGSGDPKNSSVDFSIECGFYGALSSYSTRTISGPGILQSNGENVYSLSEDTWTRLSLTIPKTQYANKSDYQVCISPYNGGATYVWGYQEENEDVASPYLKTGATQRNMTYFGGNVSQFSYTFTPGTYWVTLNVSNADGYNISTPMPITVLSPIPGGSINSPPAPIDVSVVIVGLVLGILIARNRFKET